MPQLRRIELHIGEQSVKVFLRIVADSGFHQSVDCFLQELNVEGTVLNHLDHLAEQILRFDDVAEITQSFFYDGSLVIQRSHERMKELDSETSCSDEKLDAVCDQYADCKALTYELTHAFISAVYIYDLDNIEIVWKFKDFLATSEGEAK